ncbi:Kinesin-like protein tea2 [Tetrabaena socialis]|uniref:Kinesin-like protein tea2 n=1 Tax=Tetrabaena socialis TaxID=47790 RepID=A0A2J7ZVK3_9CHLO|nr:Kinesin-like protein tea2 [Tetrabaena socialis]|eukprot:PNH04294.1 Kinesin-like protein tea2 [Tetrabaena socialis]
MARPHQVHVRLRFRRRVQRRMRLRDLPPPGPLFTRQQRRQAAPLPKHEHAAVAPAVARHAAAEAACAVAAAAAVAAGSVAEAGGGGCSAGQLPQLPLGLAALSVAAGVQALTGALVRGAIAGGAAEAGHIAAVAAAPAAIAAARAAVGASPQGGQAAGEERDARDLRRRSMPRQHLHALSDLVGFHSATGVFMAYGASGTGKSYTMQGTAAHPGMVPRTLNRLYQMLAGGGRPHPHQVQLSYYEVYENRVYDLLSSARLGKRQERHLPIQVLGASCCMPGLLRCHCASADAALRLFAAASCVRKQAATGVNAESSRSHAVFTVVGG